ncbi:MAG: pyridoxal phosphate-dependent aminotransferase [Deltaproteobacteria bacterium]|nr:pyridoxal phosphate-dependent aminotransferase [Deltaproteobacteria bacterium]
MKFSDRILKIKPSATLKAAAKARELKAKGVQVIDFTVGEPDFNTPEKIKEACKKALDENFTRYAPVPGFPELRQSICNYLKREFGLAYKPEEIIATAGAKHAIYAALQVLINPGDEVIIPAPYWVSFYDQVLLTGGKPVVIKTDDTTGFKMTPRQLEQNIGPKTKLLILNTPSNPTGSCYSGEELKKFGDICAGKNILVLSDEIYAKLTYDGFKHVSFVTACPEMREKTILVNGASKSYAMTGWRIGFAAAPKEIIDKMQILQSQEVTSVPTFIMRASITAFNDCDKEVEAMRREFEKRRDVAFAGLSKIKGVTCYKPSGAFYLFPNVKAFKKSSEEIAELLLEEAHVAVVSGESFGAPGYLRVSYATDIPSIEMGIDKMKKTLEKL